MTTVYIRWYGPYSLDNINIRDIAYHNGVYSIYRVFGGKETLLYIGKTGRSFIQRITEHNKDWLWNVRGAIQIRFGILEYPHGGRYSVQKLNDTESLLIYWHSPPFNTTYRERYYGRDKLEIINVGRRGSLDKNITTSILI
ncbi:GIY-YIG nuclease family protein (plasmid) [Bacillus sp. S3]|uniref:GIY-YIG nuclease family protein n=1 Tax=Bacillus sp. S3 TaxID=486398 RepID=UPI00118951F4|nr:GIY-YIG nuclease family protein [Bacillus sp. S3]QCJ45509.1 GIY-YIG nuclease family protein [Bacillus sp. S3]